MRILIIEDERRMAFALKRGLEAVNHCASIASDGRTALEYASTLEFDAIVLDLMLPGIDGFEVARRIRRAQNHTPILMLTARDAVPDIVRGLDSGADDYLTKPFSFDVFLARLRSVARRGSTPRPPCLQVRDLVLNPATHEVFRGDEQIRLSPTEFRLLEFLMRRTDRVVPRETIIQAVWDIDDDVEENTLEVFIRLLRNKVDRSYNPRLDVHGTGNYAQLREPADKLCLECHGPMSPNGPRAATLEEHTHHKADSAGSQCVACHMPAIETEGPANTMVHAHTFRFITPAMTDKYKIPNPCTSCHTDKSTAWAEETMSHWSERSPWRLE